MLIRAEGSMEEIQPANGVAFVLEEMQKYVGGYIEMLSIPPKVMVMNEEGKLNRLPHNRTATALTRGILSPDDVVVGDVVICTPAEAGY